MSGHSFRPYRVGILRDIVDKWIQTHNNEIMRIRGLYGKT